jgi:hypothetical protein
MAPLVDSKNGIGELNGRGPLTQWEAKTLHGAMGFRPCRFGTKRITAAGS